MKDVEVAALKKMVRAIEALAPDVMAQRRVAFHIHSRYGGPLMNFSRPVLTYDESMRRGYYRRAELNRNKDLRLFIRQRDENACRYCGIVVNWLDRRSPHGGTYDHVNPAGDNAPDNVVVACHQCNIAKNNRTPEQAGMPLRPVSDLKPNLDLAEIGGNNNSRVSPPAPPVRVAPEIPVLKPENNSNYRKEAREVLEFLNVKAGKTFRVKDTNLKLIEARLRSGASVQDCKVVIARKVREWKTDAKMNEFLRPKTLFSATNFESYLGQAEPDDNKMQPLTSAVKGES